MREIKFRVWDSERKKILPIQRHSFKTGKSMPYGWNIEYVFDGLMQYTGLKDKNGKEIYEGDILRHINPKQFKNSVYEVVFLNGGFAIKGDDYIEDLNEFLKSSSSAEVIGNIYENPELLEGEE